jgi:Domain of unknown function (DUF4157)
MAQGGVAEERPQRGKAGRCGCGAVSPVALEVVDAAVTICAETGTRDCTSRFRIGALRRLPGSELAMVSAPIASAALAEAALSPRGGTRAAADLSGGPGVGTGTDASCCGREPQSLGLRPSQVPAATARAPDVIQRCGAHSCDCPAGGRADDRVIAKAPSSRVPAVRAAAPLSSSVGDVVRSAGAPLDEATRFSMEAAFGHDFSGVRIHTDERASSSAGAVDALAYTAGQNVVFAAGQYAPGTNQGRRLLAHELAHVVQQGTGQPVPSSVSSPGDAFELAADRAAQAVLGGQSAGSADKPPTLQRRHAGQQGKIQRRAVSGEEYAWSSAPSYPAGQAGPGDGPQDPHSPETEATRSSSILQSPRFSGDPQLAEVAADRRARAESYR